MSGHHGDTREDAESTTIRAAFGLRAFSGSRLAILRAAFDLIDMTPGITVRSRSLVWRCHAPVEHLCAALGVATQSHRIEDLAAWAQSVAGWFGAGEGASVAPVAVELLWAHDPEGHLPAAPPSSPAIPLSRDVPNATAVALAPPPPRAPGRTMVHPEARTRASACGPLAEVAPDAQDPATGRYLAENLYTVSEPYIEDPQPFTPTFRTATRRFEGHRAHAVAANDRADLLAAAAEAFGRAPPSGDPIGPTTLIPTTVYPVAASVPYGAADDVRVHLWLCAVQATMQRERVVLRRAVVLDDGDVVTGRLYGTAALGDPPELGRPDRARVSFDAARGLWQGDVIIADR